MPRPGAEIRAPQVLDIPQQLDLARSDASSSPRFDPDALGEGPSDLAFDFFRHGRLAFFFPCIGAGGDCH